MSLYKQASIQASIQVYVTKFNSCPSLPSEGRQLKKFTIFFVVYLNLTQKGIFENLVFLGQIQTRLNFLKKFKKIFFLSSILQSLSSILQSLVSILYPLGSSLHQSQSLVISHSHQSLVTSHQSLVISHQSLVIVTSHQSSSVKSIKKVKSLVQ